MRRIHAMSYPLRKDANHPLQIQHRRDASALLELQTALHGTGFVLGEPILTQLPETPPAEPPRELHRVDVSCPRPGDRIVQATRPPLRDQAEGSRKQVARACTDLEERLFAVWRRHDRPTDLRWAESGTLEALLRDAA